MDRLGEFLKRAGIQLDRVMHSGKLRASQTAERLAIALAPGLELDTRSNINPNDDPTAFDWQNEGRDQNSLVVGHLPFLAKLVSHLVIEDENRLITAYQPGSIVCLELNSNAHWQINWMIRPELFG